MKNSLEKNWQEQGMKEICWGMIGCGDVTEVKSGPAFNRIEGSRLAAVMSRTEERARDYARRHGISKVYTDASRLVGDPEINAVYIATPPDSHAEYSIMTLEAGKPVYVEKPMARTYEECERMVKVSIKTGIPLYVAYYRRRLPKFMKVRELVDEEIIGAVRAVSVVLLWPPRPDDRKRNPPWRVIPEIAGGGYFVDLASHQFDLLDWLLGPLTEARGYNAHQTGWYPAEDAVSACFRFESGVIGSGLWSFTISKSHQTDRIEIVGERGTLSFSCFDPSPVRLTGESGTEEFVLPWPEHVQEPLIRTVVGALRGEGECPSTAETGARTSRILESILKS